MDWSLITDTLKAVARQPFFRSTAFIVTLCGAALIITEYMLRIRFAVPVAIPYIVYWMALGAAFAGLSLGPWRAYQHDRERLMANAFLAGLTIGVLSAVYKIVVYQELWTMINILAEPIRTGLFGILVAWMIAQERTTATAHAAPSS